MTDHLTDAAFERFVAGTMAATERAAVISHLLAGCETCRSTADRTLRGFPTDEASVSAVATDDVVARVLTRVRAREEQLTAERLAARRVYERIAGLPHSRRLTMVKNSQRCRSWAFCDVVLDGSWRARYSDPSEALALAELGVAAAEGLAEADYGAALIEDMRAHAWAVLGNGFRIMSRLAEAEASLNQAEAHVARGTGDPIERARILEMKGELRSDQRDFREALALFDNASQLYRRAGDPHLQARSLVYKGTALGKAGELDEAIAVLRQSLELLDAERDPRLLLAAQHNLILYLDGKGETSEALALLDKTRPLYASLGDEMNLLRLSWLEGKLHCSLRHFPEAERSLLLARGGLVTKEIPYDVALVSLDLATVYAQQGRTADMKRLAAEMLPIFQSLGIHREAIAAVLVFQQAAEMEAVSAGLIAELAAYFQRASKEPGLPFRAPAG